VKWVESAWTGPPVASTVTRRTHRGSREPVGASA
jgi:hypothetical protein